MERAIAILMGMVIFAGALYLALPQYQMFMGENQTIVWRLNTHTGELAVCTSPDLPAAGCKSLSGSRTDDLPGLPQTASAPQ
jgi:hypothetical protein